LTVHIADVEPVEGNKREVYGVQHQFNAHELNEKVPSGQKPNGSYRKYRRSDNQKVIGVER
jgi:hypothetical protein